MCQKTSIDWLELRIALAEAFAVAATSGVNQKDLGKIRKALDIAGTELEKEQAATRAKKDSVAWDEGRW